MIRNFLRAIALSSVLLSSAVVSNTEGVKFSGGLSGNFRQVTLNGGFEYGFGSQFAVYGRVGVGATWFKSRSSSNAIADIMNDDVKFKEHFSDDNKKKYDEFADVRSGQNLKDKAAYEFGITNHDKLKALFNASKGRSFEGAGNIKLTDIKYTKDAHISFLLPGSEEYNTFLNSQSDEQKRMTDKLGINRFRLEHKKKENNDTAPAAPAGAGAPGDLGGLRAPDNMNELFPIANTPLTQEIKYEDYTYNALVVPTPNFFGASLHALNPKDVATGPDFVEVEYQDRTNGNFNSQVIFNKMVGFHHENGVVSNNIKGALYETKNPAAVAPARTGKNYWVKLKSEAELQKAWLHENQQLKHDGTFSTKEEFTKKKDDAEKREQNYNALLKEGYKSVYEKEKSFFRENFVINAVLGAKYNFGSDVFGDDSDTELYGFGEVNFGSFARLFMKPEGHDGVKFHFTEYLHDMLAIGVGMSHTLMEFDALDMNVSAKLKIHPLGIVSVVKADPEITTSSSSDTSKDKTKTGDDKTKTGDDKEAKSTSVNNDNYTRFMSNKNETLGGFDKVTRIVNLEVGVNFTSK